MCNLHWVNALLLKFWLARYPGMSRKLNYEELKANKNLEGWLMNVKILPTRLILVQT